VRGHLAFVIVLAAASAAMAATPQKRSADSPPDAGVAVPRATRALKFGTLEIKVRGAATVFVDDRELGKAPVKPRKLLEGLHTVRFVNETLGLDETQTVEIRAGTISTLEVSFEADR